MGFAFRPVKIASGQAFSDIIDAEFRRVVGLIIPAAFTGIAITLQAAESKDAALMLDVYDKAGTQYSVTVAVSRYITLSPLDLSPLKYLRLKSGSAEAADRTVVIVLIG